jgi:hypothetical protein
MHRHSLAGARSPAARIPIAAAAAIAASAGAIGKVTAKEALAGQRQCENAKSRNHEAGRA